jgi:hypothetical protein
MQDRISQRRHQQRIEHRIHLRQHVAIRPPRATEIVFTPKIVGVHDGHRVRHVQVHNALVQIVAGQVLRLPI